MDRTGAIRVMTALCLGATILAVNTLTTMRDAVAVLYVLVVLLVADVCGSRTILVTGVLCGGLSIASFLVKHHGDMLGGADVRLIVSLVAIGVATHLSRSARQTRAALSEQAQWLAIMHDTVIIRDRNGTILDWNNGAGRLYGWTREEAIGRPEATLLGTRYMMGAPAPVLAPGAQWSGEIRRVRRDGVSIVLSSRWLGRVDENGQSAGVIELSADLTEQRRAQEARARSEQRYAAIFAGAGIAIVEVASTGRAGFVIHEANEAAARLLDAANARMLAGVDLTHHLSPDDRTAFARARLRAAASREPVALPTRLRTLTHRWRDVILTISTGADAGVMLLTALDVTDRTRALQRIERMQTDLAHAARVSALGQMTATIAHEVNQPLQASVTFARSARRWLARTPPDLGEVAHCLDRIVQTGERAAAVITRIRAMSRNEPPVMQEIDLCDLAREASDMLSGEFRRHAVHVRVDVRASLHRIRGDRVQMQQVMVNVMLNAVQAMQVVQERVLTLSSPPEAGKWTALVIEDTGPGIASDVVARAFDPFVSARPGGVGLGLSLCRTIMQAHGGRIVIDNNPDGGARVVLSWPEIAL